MAQPRRLSACEPWESIDGQQAVGPQRAYAGEHRPQADLYTRAGNADDPCRPPHCSERRPQSVPSQTGGHKSRTDHAPKKSRNSAHRPHPAGLNGSCIRAQSSAEYDCPDGHDQCVRILVGPVATNPSFHRALSTPRLSPTRPLRRESAIDLRPFGVTGPAGLRDGHTAELVRSTQPGLPLSTHGH